MTQDPEPDQSNLVFAVDLGGTHLRAAAVDENGKILFRLKQSTPHGDSANEIVRALVSLARECDRQAGEAGANIQALSVAVPGILNVSEGLVLKAPNLRALDGLRLGEALTNELKRPVILENDANAAAVGEMWQGAGRGHRTIVCLTLGTGVGGGIILEGELWRGVDGSAAEIGHMCVNPFGGVPCPCGSHDCLEVYASATAIVRLARERLPLYSASNLGKERELTSEKVYDAGVAGDQLALEVFRVMGVYLGAGLASLVNVINPEIMIIAGGAANGWDLFEKYMRHEVTDRNFPLPAARVKIVRAECGDDAGLLGAARLAFEARFG